MVVVLLFGGVMFGDVADDMTQQEQDAYMSGYLDGYLDSVNGKPNKFFSDIEPESSIPKTNWKIAFHIDYFGDYSKRVYITNAEDIIGSFSNTVTRNSKLKVKVIADNGGIEFELYEYGLNLVYWSPNNNYDYRMIIKDQQEKSYLLKLRYYGLFGMDTVLSSIERADTELLQELFISDQILKFVIQGVYPTSYSFTIDTTGFKNLYMATFPYLFESLE